MLSQVEQEIQIKRKELRKKLWFSGGPAPQPRLVPAPEPERAVIQIADRQPKAESVEVKGPSKLHEIQAQLKRLFEQLREAQEELKIEIDERPWLTSKTIILTVCKYYGVSYHDVIGPWRGAKIIRARHVAMYLVKRLGNKSYPAVGRAFSKRDHSTVMNACGKITRLLATDAQLDREIADLTQLLTSGDFLDAKAKT